MEGTFVRWDLVVEFSTPGNKGCWSEPPAQSSIFLCLQFLHIFCMSGRTFLEGWPGIDVEWAALGRQCFLLINLTSHPGDPNVLIVYERMGE